MRQFALAPLSSTVQLLQFVLHLLLIIYAYRWLGAAPVMAACDASGRKRRDMLRRRWHWQSSTMVQAINIM